MLSSEECSRVIDTCWKTPSTRNKARRILHSIFAYAIQRGWTDKNPLDGVAREPVRERRISPLSLDEVRRLLEVVSMPQFSCCAAAVGLMLWAGIRPNEVERLCWGDIRAEHNVIVLTAEHTKTGGARQVTLHPILLEWLHKTSWRSVLNQRITPRSWARRWKEVRRLAGFRNWAPDTLRHTFASYHILKFRNYAQLQLEMGHASVDLLRTRYISLDDITRADADIFWDSLSRLMAEPVKSNRDRGKPGVN